MNYKQCELQKGKQEKVAWIPEYFAVKGKYLKLSGDNGWLVTGVGVCLSAEYVEDHERDYTRQRNYSDIIY